MEAKKPVEVKASVNDVIHLVPCKADEFVHVHRGRDVVIVVVSKFEKKVGDVRSDF